MIDFEDSLKAIGGGLLSLFALIIVLALLGSVDFGIGFNPFATTLSIAVSGLVLAIVAVFVVFVLKIIKEFVDW